MLTWRLVEEEQPTSIGAADFSTLPLPHIPPGRLPSARPQYRLISIKYMVLNRILKQFKDSLGWVWQLIFLLQEILEIILSPTYSLSDNYKLYLSQETQIKVLSQMLHGGESLHPRTLPFGRVPTTVHTYAAQMLSSLSRESRHTALHSIHNSSSRETHVANERLHHTVTHY